MAEAWWSYMRQKEVTPQRLELKNVDGSEKDVWKGLNSSQISEETQILNVQLNEKSFAVT